ncbi:hypothetical protein J4232_03885 [Candidatus Woesearchaeota archaeon]|nr:hypothetical protein [Candidatus Woesearchaeota archaeon]
MLVTLFSTIAKAELTERKLSEKAHKLHYYSERLIPIITIVGFVLLFLMI